MKELTTLLENVMIQNISGNIDRKVATIETDSRKVINNTLFVCIPGYTVDGHDYVRSAIEKGATIVVAERPLEEDSNITYIYVKNTTKALAYLAANFYKGNQDGINMIGVTGTNGKSTIAWLTTQLLRQLGQAAGSIGTIGIDINGELKKSTNTTNDILTTQKIIQEMKDNGVKNIVMEVSSHGLMLGRLWGVEFQTGIFSNLTQDHLDFHGTMTNYGFAKSLLFSQMGSSLNGQKLSVLNADDEWSKFYEEVSPHHILTYGINNPCDLQAKDISYRIDGTSFTLVYNKECYEVNSPLIGEFNVYNLLSSIAVLIGMDFTVRDVLPCIPSIQSVPGRMEKVQLDNGYHIYVDYAHTADGIEKALLSIKDFVKGKLVVSIGTGGERDITKRPIMGEVASKHSDYVVITTDNPRFEPYESILSGMEQGMIHNHYACIGDRQEAIEHGLSLLEKDDCFIIMGKGHEKYQIIGNEEVPFDEIDIIKNFFKNINN